MFSEVVAVTFGKYNQPDFYALFKGWHSYVNAPEKVNAFMKDMEGLVEYDPGNGDYEFHYPVLNPASKRRNVISWLHITFGADGLLRCVIHTGKSNGARGIQKALDLFEEKRSIIAAYGFLRD